MLYELKKQQANPQKQDFEESLELNLSIHLNDKLSYWSAQPDIPEQVSI